MKNGYALPFIVAHSVPMTTRFMHQTPKKIISQITNNVMRGCDFKYKTILKLQIHVQDIRIIKEDN